VLPGRLLAGSFPDTFTAPTSCLPACLPACLPVQCAEEEQDGGRGSGKAAGRKCVGRPLSYSGDPNAPNLTDAEKRKIKRCVA
jgi:hypothetical protein